MRVLLDLNVLMDFLLKRQPWCVEAIITRNPADFTASPIPIMSPTELLEAIA